MELPLGGPALRHYTQSRPRPHRQKLNYRPSKPQETIIESENEVLELMGRVDEGVEEFFTKRVLPTDILKKEDEESITVQEVAPASSIPCPPPTKTLRRKLGDFFTLKKRRGLKSETSHEGRPKKASIADFIRPLRDVARADKEKDKDRVKEHDKENEKEKAKEHPSAGESVVQETPASGAPPLRGEVVPPRRALREGKSQSLILLSGSAATGTPNARNTAKKQMEGQHSFEQKLHLMLQRIGVSKAQPGETQNQEGEMKKAESEGTIIDSKPEPSASFSKPRTMSASSDTRHQIRSSVSAHDSAGKPALPPKPVIKPGPPPTTSGQNTPENELAQIQEGETSTPTKHSPPAAPCPPAAPALTATTTTSTVLTISNSIPDSTSFTIPSSSTVTPTDTDICTDSVNTTAAATTPMNVTELDSKASDGGATTTELPTATILLTEPPASVSVTSTSSDLITQTLSVTSNSTATTAPSITTMETVSAPSNENSVSITLPNLSTESTLPDLNGVLSSDSTPAAAGGVVTTVCSPSTSTSDMPSCLVPIANSATETSDDSSLVTSTSCEALASSITKTTSSSNSSDTIIATISPDAPVVTSSTTNSVALLPTSSTSSSITTTSTGSPTPIDFMNSISASNISQPDSLTHIDISVPSTSSGLTNPTDTTSTATSLNHADTTSTTSSATTAPVTHTQPADSAYINNLSNNFATPAISGLPVTDASSCHLTSPARSTENPDQNNILQTSLEEPAIVEPIEKAEEELDMVQESKIELDENKEVVDDKKTNGKPMLASSEETRKEVQEESEKAEQDIMTKLPSGKEGECSADDIVDGQKQEEESVSEK